MSQADDSFDFSDSGEDDTTPRQIQEKCAEVRERLKAIHARVEARAMTEQQEPGLVICLYQVVWLVQDLAENVEKLQERVARQEDENPPH